MITSVEEGETEEVQQGKGFGNPDDSSFDPPGTITIPLPPTVYEAPKPGEEAKELPLPEFKLPASIFEGKLPSESMTLSPDGTKLPTGTKLPLEPLKDISAAQAANPTVPAATQDLSPPAGAPPILPPAPPLLLPVQTPVLAQPPPPAPPPPAIVSSGGSLPYPKLPPVTVSEIPNRVNRQPPLILPKPKGVATGPVITLPRPPPAVVAAPAVTLPKPPPIHVNGDVLLNGAPVGNAAAPRPDPLTPVPACGKSCDAPAPPVASPPVPAPSPAPAAPPVHAPPPAPARPPAPAPAHVAPHAPAASHKYAQPVIEKQQDMRYGVSYGKSRRG